MNNVSRDLFLLSALAFQQGDYSKAGELFSSSLSSDDAADFLAQVDSMGEEDTMMEANSSDKNKLSDIAKAISRAIGSHASTSADEAVDDAEESGDEEDLDEDSDIESDDVDSDAAGERIIPSALSSVSSAIKVKA